MIVDDPVVTAEYEAIAAALRPHAVDGFLGELTFPQVVGIAAAAVAPMLDACRSAFASLERDSTLAARDHRQSMERVVRAADAAVADAVASSSRRIAGLESLVEWWRIEAERNGARLAVLEALAVQAEARWGHEGGPSPLREALEAARPADGD